MTSQYLKHCKNQDSASGNVARDSVVVSTSARHVGALRSKPEPGKHDINMDGCARELIREGAKQDYIRNF